MVNEHERHAFSFGEYLHSVCLRADGGGNVWRRYLVFSQALTPKVKWKNYLLSLSCFMFTRFLDCFRYPSSSQPAHTYKADGDDREQVEFDS